MKKISFFSGGFHLIEILISLSVVGLFAAFSISSYTQHLTRTQRLEAATLLSQLAIAMEDYHIRNNTYREVTLATLHFPEWTAKKTYRLIIQNTTDHDYLLIAKPQGQQAKRDTLCKALTLNAVGKKEITGSLRWDECW